MATLPHCYYCFDVLVSHLERREPRSLANIEQLFSHQQATLRGQRATNGGSEPTSQGPKDALGHEGAVVNGFHKNPSPPKMPLFVTWKAHSKSGRLELRGCIGTFEPKSLASGLRDYALTANNESRHDRWNLADRALHDSRFQPISIRELPKLECGVTLLTDFEPADGPEDWTIGVHGLQIDFVYHHRRMGATYLPDVPQEQGWTKTETLISLMRKAGWTGRREEWTKVDLKITRYQGSKQIVTWDDYVELVSTEWSTVDVSRAQDTNDAVPVRTNGGSL